MVESITKAASQIGNRKLGVVYTVLGMVFTFLIVRSLLPIWVVTEVQTIEGVVKVTQLKPLDDIPPNLMMLMGGVPAAFFGVNLWGKFAPSVTSGQQPS